MKYYIICSQPRSGTHLLRAYLKGLKVGNPVEIFYELTEDLKRDEKRVTIENIYKRGKLGKNGKIWGATFFYKHYLPAMKQIRKLKDLEDMSNFEILNNLFPDLKFIYFYRLNKIKQAISWDKASQSGQYVYEDEIQSNPEYSPDSIRDIILKLVKDEAQWMNFFETYNITPHIITYESLCEDKVNVISGILDFLGVRFDSSLTLADSLAQMELTKQQYDATSEEWYRRFLLDILRQLK